MYRKLGRDQDLRHLAATCRPKSLENGQIVPGKHCACELLCRHPSCFKTWFTQGIERSENYRCRETGGNCEQKGVLPEVFAERVTARGLCSKILQEVVELKYVYSVDIYIFDRSAK